MAAHTYTHTHTHTQSSTMPLHCPVPGGKYSPKQRQVGGGMCVTNGDHGTRQSPIRSTCGQDPFGLEHQTQDGEWPDLPDSNLIG